MPLPRPRHVITLIAAVIAVPCIASGQAQAVVSGTVRTAGEALPNARAVLDSSREVRSDAAGRFQFRDVSPGRHSLAVLAIGMTPYSANLIVRASDTLDFAVVLVKTVILDSVIIEGSTVRQQFARAYEERKRIGLGRFMDSAVVKQFAYVRQAILFIPGVKATSNNARYRGTGIFLSDAMGIACLPNMLVDGHPSSGDELSTIRPDDVMGIEVYPRPMLIPEEFKLRFSRECGAIVIWTRRFWPEGKKKP
jgi:hypothetical protein